MTAAAVDVQHLPAGQPLEQLGQQSLNILVRCDSLVDDRKGDELGGRAQPPAVGGVLERGLGLGLGAQVQHGGHPGRQHGCPAARLVERDRLIAAEHHAWHHPV